MVVQTEARGETGARMEGMVGEKGILPERSEWFRSRRVMERLAAFLGPQARQACACVAPPYPMWGVFA